MKRYIAWLCLMVLSLCSCDGRTMEERYDAEVCDKGESLDVSADSSEEVEEKQYPETSPLGLMLEYQGEIYGASVGSYSWDWTDEDGVCTGEEACGDHVLMSPFVGNPISMEDTSEIILRFGGKDPDALEVHCWSIEQMGDETAFDDYTEIKVNNGKISVPVDGGYAYEVIASWTEADNWGGTVEYYFFTDAPGDPVTGVFSEADPYGSALMVFCDDEVSTKVRTIYDRQRVKALLKELEEIEFRPVAIDRVGKNWGELSYGLSISGKDGTELRYAYSNNLWIVGAGDVYQAEYDFEALWASLEGEEERKFQRSEFPDAAWIIRYTGGTFREKAPDHLMEAEVTLESAGRKDNVATMILTNHSSEDFYYGALFSLEQKIDNQWYVVPVEEPGHDFSGVELTLPAGEMKSINYDLSWYGTLEPGSYRIVQDEVCGEFEIKS